MNEKIEALMKGVGAFAEIALLYFKSTMNSGATFEEATALTKIFVEAFLSKAM